ncbi:MAG: sigma-70 family RNA polymerase sigma factor [Pseudomonadota bacterium]
MKLSRDEIGGYPTVTESDSHTAKSDLATNEALQALYERFFLKLVVGLRATYGDGPPDPEDIAQAAFVKLKKRGSLDDIRDPEGFVWIAARNLMLSEKRKQAVANNHSEEISRRYFSDGCDNFDPECVFRSQQQLTLVAQTLNEMPERRRRIFILNRVHGLTPAQAGARCGVSRSSAVRHIAIASEALVRTLNDADVSLDEEKRK